MPALQSVEKLALQSLYWPAIGTARQLADLIRTHLASMIKLKRSPAICQRLVERFLQSWHLFDKISGPETPQLRRLRRVHRPINCSMNRQLLRRRLILRVSLQSAINAFTSTACRWSSNRQLCQLRYALYTRCNPKLKTPRCWRPNSACAAYRCNTPSVLGKTQNQLPQPRSRARTLTQQICYRIPPVNLLRIPGAVPEGQARLIICDRSSQCRREFFWQRVFPIIVGWHCPGSD